MKEQLRGKSAIYFIFKCKIKDKPVTTIWNFKTKLFIQLNALISNQFLILFNYLKSKTAK